jgi:hypothetical protein
LSNEQKPTVPFVLTLIGGLTVTYVGVWRFGFMERMMRGYRYAFAAGPGYFSPFVSFMGMLGIIFGVIVIASAVMLNRQPRQHQTWSSDTDLLNPQHIRRLGRVPCRPNLGNRWRSASDRMEASYNKLKQFHRISGTLRQLRTNFSSFMHPHLFCTNCGKDLRLGAAFCFSCGMKQWQ